MRLDGKGVLTSIGVAPIKIIQERSDESLNQSLDAEGRGGAGVR